MNRMELKLKSIPDLRVKGRQIKEYDRVEVIHIYEQKKKVKESKILDGSEVLKWLKRVQEMRGISVRTYSAEYHRGWLSSVLTLGIVSNPAWHVSGKSASGSVTITLEPKAA